MGKMKENELIAELGGLQEEVLAAKRRLQRRGPRWRQIVARSDIVDMQTKLDDFFERLATLDKQAIQIMKVPGDINSRIMVSASVSIVSDSRESVRSILTAAYGDIASLRSQLNFYASLIVALIALVVSIVGVVS